jgi:hypothetical protein
MSTSSESVIAEVPLAQFAAVTAALAEGFPLRAVLSVEGLDAARWAAADRAWTERLDQDPALLSRYQTSYAAAQSRLLSRDEPAPEEGAPARPAPLRAGKARLVRSGTGLAAPVASFAMPSESPAVPAFEPVMMSAQPYSAPAPAPVMQAEPPRMHAEPPMMRAEPPILRTAMPSVIPPPPPAPARPTWAADDQEQTAYAPDPSSTVAIRLKPMEVFPFRATPGGAGEPSRSRPQPRTLAGTSPSLDEVLPFRAVPSHNDPAPERRGPGGSEDSGTHAAFQVQSGGLPFAPAPSREPPAAPRDPRPFVPPVAAPVAAWPEPPPSMSLERHASMCLEIALDPSRVAEVLACYQVTAQEKASADEYYRARIAVEPELGAQWNNAYATYHAWFMSRSRP